MKKEEEVPIKNLVDFAIDSAILRVDNDKNPVVDRNRLKMILIEVFKKREKRLERLLKEKNKSNG
jgi:16S rRNA A1518/A1519 N6-dimethyltransferase RsmA/KsgA/DIM1 with predicted DNA glycosylase/AP lyase activity